ncbi:unnamed protein product [Closterium sp. Naga37s-1]|nr:unnamed protein product [Closterium sp. Naga37s-1]
MKLATWSRTAPYVVLAASAVLFAAAVTIRFTNPDLASCTPADMGDEQKVSGAQGSDEASRFLISNFGLPGPVPWEWIRKSVQDQFTLDGRVQVKSWFMDADAHDSGAKPFVWSNDGIDQQAAMARRRDTGFGSYGPNVTGSFYSAFEKYPAITTVDFNRPVASHPRLRQLVVGELEGSSETWDVAVSFSSLEHDGLGRYGDPINPNGDLERMKKVGEGSTRWVGAARGGLEQHEVAASIKGLLKPGGLLFLGVPTGNDTLVFNAHRIYGPIRMPLLTAGWRLLDVFGVDSLKKLYRIDFEGIDVVQPLLVLRRD